MTRTEAIETVFGYVCQIEGEWGYRTNYGGMNSEAREVLTALGVTEAEMLAAGLAKGNES